MKYLRQLSAILASEPALISTVLAAAAALVAAYFARVTPTQEAAIVTIGTAVAALLTAALARPVGASVITGSVATVLAASASFGLHLTASQSATTVGAVGIILALMLRHQLTPLSSVPSPVPAVTSPVTFTFSDVPPSPGSEQGAELLRPDPGPLEVNRGRKQRRAAVPGRAPGSQAVDLG